MTLELNSIFHIPFFKKNNYLLYFGGQSHLKKYWWRLLFSFKTNYFENVDCSTSSRARDNSNQITESKFSRINIISHVCICISTKHYISIPKAQTYSGSIFEIFENPFPYIPMFSFKLERNQLTIPTTWAIFWSSTYHHIYIKLPTIEEYGTPSMSSFSFSFERIYLELSLKWLSSETLTSLALSSSTFSIYFSYDNHKLLAFLSSVILMLRICFMAPNPS